MTEVYPKKHPIFDEVQFGLGTWAWGDRLYWGYGTTYNEADLQAACQVSLAAGINFFDTAEVYGQGLSETFLGKFLKDVAPQPIIATKFMPYPWRLSRRSLLKALKNSLKRLDRQKVDLYMMHQALPPIRIEIWMDAMVEAYSAGLVGAIGVSNYDRQLTQRAYDSLTREGIQLASNQMEYSLLERKVEKNGLLKHCQDLGVTLIAYSPLAEGTLTGKYSPENPIPGFRGTTKNRSFLAKIAPLISTLRKIGAAHQGKTPAQVAINWVICKGAVPIAGAKTSEQAEQNAGAIGWRLTDDEVALLDDYSDRVTKKQPLYPKK
ncbi:MAG: aldo/keto reductase [Anaerolineaceae bacterium]|nr:aldo/keto reductase [Anaerolineaceae bacterium]